MVTLLIKLADFGVCLLSNRNFLCGFKRNRIKNDMDAQFKSIKTICNKHKLKVKVYSRPALLIFFCLNFLKCRLGLSIGTAQN